MKKKIILTLAVVVAIFVAVLFGNPKFLTGKLTFFKGAPTVSNVIDYSYLSYGEAVDLLINAASGAKRIDDNAAQQLRAKYAAFADRKMNRGEFASLAVEVFKLQSYGFGETLTDVPVNSEKAKNIYLFTSNGALGTEFKEGNPATRVFAESAADNLMKRFSAVR
ncbi:hypothetical protein HZA42_04955 [Candidatus Peregrinibacteria bacterium]|nr:hypothetical protein [Candidatus Peregrinibacteria bacterium]